MKNLFLLILLPVLSFSQSSDTISAEIKWSTDFEAAKDQAEKEKKNIMAYFTGSDWCGPCIKLKKDFFETKEFATISKEYVLIYIDIPRKKSILSTEQLEHNMALLPKLNKKGVFPHFTILNADEKILDQFSGYNMDGKIDKHLAFLKKNK